MSRQIHSAPHCTFLICRCSGAPPQNGRSHGVLAGHVICVCIRRDRPLQRVSKGPIDSPDFCHESRLLFLFAGCSAHFSSIDQLLFSISLPRTGAFCLNSIHSYCLEKLYNLRLGRIALLAQMHHYPLISVSKPKMNFFRNGNNHGVFAGWVCMLTLRQVEIGRLCGGNAAVFSSSVAKAPVERECAHLGGQKIGGGRKLSCCKGGVSGAGRIKTREGAVRFAIRLNERVHGDAVPISLLPDGRLFG